MTPKDLFQWGLALAFVIVALGYAAVIVRQIWKDGL